MNKGLKYVWLDSCASAFCQKNMPQMLLVQGRWETNGDLHLRSTLEPSQALALVRCPHMWPINKGLGYMNVGMISYETLLWQLLTLKRGFMWDSLGTLLYFIQCSWKSWTYKVWERQWGNILQPHADVIWYLEWLNSLAFNQLCQEEV